MKDFNFNNNILHIKVNGYGDELLLDTMDMTIFERFASLSKKMDVIADESSKELEKISGKYADQQSDDVDAEFIREYIGASVVCSKRILTELDEVFGAGFTGKVFRENYELNPNFAPDELAITELIEALIPIMEDAYGERIKRNKSKYSATKKGKHTKAKDELIAEYKEKNGIE